MRLSLASGGAWRGMHNNLNAILETKGSRREDVIAIEYFWLQANAEARRVGLSLGIPHWPSAKTPSAVTAAYRAEARKQLAELKQLARLLKIDLRTGKPI